MASSVAASASAPKRKEADVYDRQIRLWGAEAQAKMAQSKVLYIHVTGLSSEILKNLVLAGIRASICDGRSFAQASATTPSFFWTAQDRLDAQTKTVAEVMAPKIEELNPLLGACEISHTPVADLDAAYVGQFSIVVASRISAKDATRLSDMVTSAGHVFYMADCFGLSGASALDLGASHVYRPERGKSLLDPVGIKQHVPLSTILQVPLGDAVNRFFKTAPPAPWIQYQCILHHVDQHQAWPTAADSDAFVACVTAWIARTAPTLVDHAAVTPTALERLARTATAEVAPVCSVLGGILGNEIIKAISGKGEPANNTVLFDGSKVWTFLVKPKE